MHAVLSPVHSGPAPLTHQNWPAALAGDGYAVIHGLVPHELCLRLQAEARAAGKDRRHDGQG